MYTVQFLPYTPLSGTAGPYNTVYSYLLHHPLTEDRHILEPDLQLRMNESGSFTFTVTQKHPYYARMLQDPLWDAAVYRDGKFLWAGHPLIQDIDIYGNVTFQCEGVLGYLADNYIGTFSDRKTPGGWLYTFLARARYQQFLAGGNMAFHRSFWSDGSSDFDYTGAVEPDGSGGYVYSESKNGVRRYSKAPMPAMNAIQTRLIDYFGGMLSVTLEGTESKYRVDYTNPWKRPASLPPDHVFQIGRNITDASVSVDYTDFCTAIAFTDSGGSAVRFPEQHDSYWLSDTAYCPKNQFYFVNTALQRQYGLIVKEQAAELENVYDTSGAVTAEAVGTFLLAVSQLKAPQYRVQVTAVETDTPFCIGDIAQVVLPAHGIRARMVLSELSIRLDDPTSCTATLSGTVGEGG